jgi:hypothetical protein
MTGRRRLLVAGLVAGSAVVGGTACGDPQGDDRPDGPATTAGQVAEGTAPSGAVYTISRVSGPELGQDESEAFCFEIATPAASSRGCAPVPDENGLIDGQAQRPSFAVLGADRFFAAVAAARVTAMEVGVDGEATTGASRSLDAGSAGTLLLVTVGGQTISSRDPSSSRDYEVRFLDADGGTVRKIAVSDPGE